MSRLPGERIFGVETEFGCLVADETLGDPEDAVEVIKEYLFTQARLGAIDLHARDDVFEPARSGGFLMNGARLYIDAVGSHLEYATAECRDLADLIANDRAGQRQIVRALKELDHDNDIDIYNNSVDHFGGHTFGCHENYLVKADDDILNNSVHMLYPFLVTRQIFAGVGRVGGHILTDRIFRPSYQDMMERPVDYIWVSHIYDVIPDDSVKFQLSQRADHILKPVASRVRFNRALINPKWDQMYSYDGMTRLHMLFGESNQNEFAYALKVGTTCLVLRLLEESRVPESLAMHDPIGEMQRVSRDESLKWPIELVNGVHMSAVDLQREYLKLAQVYRGESKQNDWILDNWESVLNGLESDPMSMGDRIDWVAKRYILEQYMTEEGLDWGDDALHSVDLEYHNINPSKSLFYAYQEMGKTLRIVSDLDITMAMTDPPQNTRAKGRGMLVEKVLAKKNPRFYIFEWSGAALDRESFLDMSDPFDTYSDLAQI